MIVQKLQILIDAQDRASKKLEGLKGKIKGMQDGMRKVGAASMAVGTAITGAAVMAVKAYQKQEMSEKKLEHLTRTLSGATDEQIQKLKDQATALEKVGVVGDEITMVGQAQLATFGMTTEQIGKLTPLLLDLAVNEKGVNVTQEDMISKGNALGRALEGGVGALTRFGVSLTDNQKELFRVADKSERVALLVEILEGNYGGLNKAMGDTAAGGMKRLENSLGTLKELIGKPLSDVLDKLVKEQLEPIVEKAKEFVQENPDIVGGIAKITAMAGLLMIPLGSIVLALPSIANSLKLLISPWGLVASAAVLALGKILKAYLDFKIELGKLDKSFGEWINKTEEYKHKLKEMWKTGAISTDEYREKLKKVLEDEKQMSDIWTERMKGGWFGKIVDWGENVSGKIRGILGFAEGGVVPGPIGSPIPAIVHGGETIIPNGKTMGNTFNFNFSGATITNKEQFAQEIVKILNRQVRFSYL